MKGGKTSPQSAAQANNRRNPMQDTAAQNSQSPQNKQQSTQYSQSAQGRAQGTQNTAEAKAQQNNTNSQPLDSLVNTASKHLNTNPEELKKAAQSGSLKKLASNMTPSQAAQLEKILSDENAAKKLLSTPQAQALLRGLQKNE